MSRRRLTAKEKKKDLDAQTAMEAFEDYDPSNEEFSKAAVNAAKEKMQAKQTVEIRSKAKYDGDKDDAVDAEWEFHKMMQGVDKQVVAQYGENSNELQALGLKKRSDYKKKSTRKPKPATN